MSKPLLIQPIPLHPRMSPEVRDLVTAINDRFQTLAQPVEQAPVLYATLKTNAAIANNVGVNLPWLRVAKNRLFTFDSAGQRVRVPKDGWYASSAGVRWAVNNIGGRLTYLVYPGGSAASRQNAKDDTEQSVSGIFEARVGDVIGPVTVGQSSGGNLNVIVDDRTFWSIAWLGPL